MGADDHPGAPPPGWTPFCGRLEPINTLLGAMQRGVRVYGVCYESGCKRSQQLDGLDMARAMLDHLPLGTIARMFSCNRLDRPCHFALKRDPDPPRLPLRELEGRAFVKVRLVCEAGDCKGQIEVTARGMATQLQARGVGDSTTNVFALPTLVGPCKACGKKRWRAEVVWPDTDTLGFRKMQREAAEARRLGRQAKSA